MVVDTSTVKKRLKIAEQSHYREVPRWEIFMEQELRFGLDLGQLAVVKIGLGRLRATF